MWHATSVRVSPLEDSTAFPFAWGGRTAQRARALAGSVELSSFVGDGASAVAADSTLRHDFAYFNERTALEPLVEPWRLRQPPGESRRRLGSAALVRALHQAADGRAKAGAGARTGRTVVAYASASAAVATVSACAAGARPKYLRPLWRTHWSVSIPNCRPSLRGGFQGRR